MAEGARVGGYRSQKGARGRLIKDLNGTLLRHVPPWPPGSISIKITSNRHTLYTHSHTNTHTHTQTLRLTYPHTQKTLTLTYAHTPREIWYLVNNQQSCCNSGFLITSVPNYQSLIIRRYKYTRDVRRYCTKEACSIVRSNTSLFIDSYSFTSCQSFANLWTKPATLLFTPLLTSG